MKLDIQVTLRCNVACANCIKFSNRDAITGLDYSDSDMTLGQIDTFVAQVKELPKHFFHRIIVTGGEATMHPQIHEIMKRLETIRPLVRPNRHKRAIVINSNLIEIAPPELQKYIVNFSEPKNNPAVHNVAFLHPSEFHDGPLQTWDGCNHFRKSTMVLNYMGYSQCCAGDGYIRLFGLDELVFDKPPSAADLKPMDKVCQHCPFGRWETLPLQKDRGVPVSEIYKLEAEKNRAGRRIEKRFPSS